MVYVTGAWGMGETETSSHQCSLSSSSSSNTGHSSPIAASSFCQDHDEEVSLHPLKNQVSFSENVDNSMIQDWRVDRMLQFTVDFSSGCNT